MGKRLPMKAITDSDAGLVRAAKAGDLAAFEELVSRHERQIYSLAFRILQNSHDAEDVTQQAFTSAIEHLAGFREEASFATWLNRIATFAALKVIRKLKDTAGRPIFLPGYDGLGGPMPDTLLGYGITINQDVAAMAANAKSILFGDFTFYKIRDVMDIQIFRFDDSAYIKLGQIGFLAWMRSGGSFVDVGGAVKYYQNSAT